MSTSDDILEGLNPEQRDAARHGEGPLLVLAGAGSGKTRTLTHRIAHLIATGKAAPYEILAVTFTNKAAREMRERIEELLGGGSSGVWVATFHSTCARILRREIGHLGYEPGFVIYDDVDSLTVIKRVLKALHADDRSFPPRSVRAQIDRFKNRGLLPADLDGEESLDASRLKEIYQRYQTELRRANALDFGDLLLLTLRLFENHPGVLGSYQRRWSYLLVDEYQDTNPVQYRMLRLLAAEHQNLCVVGDEDQSIYRFREADIRNILDFEKDFAGARVVRLERNYRSTQAILDAATAVVSNNTERKGKRLFTDRVGGEPLRFYEASDERAEAAYVVGETLRLLDLGVSPADIAVFYRTHAQSRALEEELLKYNRPYSVIGGTRFYDRAEIKDALAYLRVMRNPNDTASLLRIINKPARGIGRTTVNRLIELAEAEGTSVYEALSRTLQERRVAGAAGKRLREFWDLLAELSGVEAGDPVVGTLMRLLDRTGFVTALEREGTVESESRLENLRELISAAEEFDRSNAATSDAFDLAWAEGEPTPAGAAPIALDLFLEGVTLMNAADALNEEGGRVTLMTVHVAKGLEFPVVFMVGLEEGVFPHFASLSDPASLEEERRICYVGMTRAKDRLYLTNATLRRMSGTVRYNQPSRFLREIPTEVRPGSVSHEPTSISGPTIDFNEGQWEGDELPPLASGNRVEHPVFGAGTLVRVIGEGRNTKLRIRFDAAGVKTVVLRYAQLRILS